MAFRTGAFLDGINNGLSLAQRFSSMRDQRDMREVANSKPVESAGYTAEDGQRLEGLASAKDASGKPYYNVTANESGNYAVTPNQEAQGFGLSDYSGSREPAKIDQGKVTDFMGDRTAGSLSDGQINAKKQAGMADIVARTDPARAAGMRRDVVRADREDVRAQREDAEWTRKESAAKQDQSFKDQYTKAYSSTIYGQRMAEYGPQAEAYTKQMAERKAALESGMDPAKLGPAPVEPAKPGYSVSEALADQGVLLNLKLQSGKATPEEVSRFAQTIKTVNDEGYTKALQSAQSGAPIEAVAQAFNANGQIKFDPATVTSDKLVKQPDGMTTRVIEIADPATGQKQTINTLSELDSLGKATTYYERFVRMANADRLERGNAPAGYRFAEGGNLEKIPGGPPDRGAITSSGTIGREERLRYTSLFQDAGRRQAEAQKSYNTLIKERAYANAKPDSPQAQELESLRDAIKQYGDERKTYQSMLAEGASKSAENPAGRVGLGATNSSERGMAEQTKGGMGADAASIRREIAAAQSDIARAPDAESKRMLADHVANMERQLAGISGQSQGLSAMRQPARQAAGQPVKVATKAERDALPAGTQYIDPNGQVFVKK